MGILVKISLLIDVYSYIGEVGLLILDPPICCIVICYIFHIVNLALGNYYVLLPQSSHSVEDPK